MIFWKTAWKNVRHEILISLITVLQVTAALVIALIMISSVLIRYQYYTPFKDYFRSNGVYAMFSTFANGDVESWSRQAEMTDEEREAFYANIDDIFLDSDDLMELLCAEDILACHTVELYQENTEMMTISYNDAILENFTPELESGRWLKTSDKADTLEVVISENAYGWDVGDEIQLSYGNEPMTATVVGKLKDGAKIPWQSGRSGADTFQLFYGSYSFETEKMPALLFSSDYLKNTSAAATQSVMYSAVITFPDDFTDEEMDQVRQQLASYGCSYAIPLQDIDANSRDYLYTQVYQLLPILIVLLVLTMVSAVSASALSARRRLKDYAIYTVTGLSWKRCIVIHLLQSVILLICAIVLSAICLVVLQYTSIADYVKLIWSPIMILSGVVVLVFYLVVSLLMPLLMIGKHTPKEILTQ